MLMVASESGAEGELCSFSWIFRRWDEVVLKEQLVQAKLGSFGWAFLVCCFKTRMLLVVKVHLGQDFSAIPKIRIDFPAHAVESMPSRHKFVCSFRCYGYQRCHINDCHQPQTGNVGSLTFGTWQTTVDSNIWFKIFFFALSKFSKFSLSLPNQNSIYQSMLTYCVCNSWRLYILSP